MHFRSAPPVGSWLPRECAARRSRLPGVHQTYRADRHHWRCAGTLPKARKPWPKPWHLLERRAGAKRTARLTVADDAARQSVADAGNSRQQRRGCRVDVNAHGVDAILDYRIEGAREFLFAEIVLILAHADRSGINFDQLGERVLKPPGDRDRSAQGHVEVRQLLRAKSRSRVDRGPGL